jgi:HD-GYP domain-containing protein (c-di-GMP phosphodiesterase class II)
MISYTAISPFEIAAGEPLPFDVFLKDGTLLLSRGSRIASEQTRLYLLENAIKLIGRPQSQGSVFSRMEAIADRLGRLEQDYVQRVNLDQWLGRVRTLAQDLIDVADDDPDAAFAVMYLDIHHSYDVTHHVVAGLVCSRLALVSAFSPSERLTLVCGAITHDIALLHDRQAIDHSDELSPAVQSQVHGHCQRGGQLLREIGVSEPLWLAVVEQHHERLDGSGYAGLRDRELAPPSRILALADSFSAMLRHRPYRERILAKPALATLYADPQGRYDQGLIASLIYELGLYPPGSLLRLASREMAIAVRPTPGEIDYPQIVAITDPAGHPRYRAAPRDPHDEDSAIVSLLPLEKAGLVRNLLPDCWQRSAVG